MAVGLRAIGVILGLGRWDMMQETKYRSLVGVWGSVGVLSIP